MLTVHGRTRANMKQSITEADWGVVRAIKQAVGIPVVANGSVACLADVDACLRATGCDGVMVSEALLEDPGLFSGGMPTRGPLLARRGGGFAGAPRSAGGACATTDEAGLQDSASLKKGEDEGSREADHSGQRAGDPAPPLPGRCSQFELCARYLELAVEFPAGWPAIKPHVFKMLFGALRVFPDLRQRLGEKARSVDEVAAIVREAAARFEASAFKGALAAGSAELAALRAEARLQRERNPRCAWSEPEFLLDPSFPGSWYMRFRPDAYSGRRAPARNSEEMAPSRAPKRAADEAANDSSSAAEAVKAARVVGEVTQEAGGCFTWGSC
jgi:hypothetical protein